MKLYVREKFTAVEMENYTFDSYNNKMSLRTYDSNFNFVINIVIWWSQKQN